MPNNVFSMPTYGKPIALHDQGIYYTVNKHTGDINSLFQLIYQDEWYLYQLESTGKEGENTWSILAENIDYSLKSMASEQIRYHFSRPEYAEPKGAWQIIKNSKYGFGKFTPAAANDSVKYAILLFSENKMRTPLLIHKAEEEVLQGLLEFA